MIFILADDLGYGDLSCYGRPDYKTPMLDKLAAEGVRFTDAYAAAPVCTPTRCAFHTGRYPQRLAVGLKNRSRTRTTLWVYLLRIRPSRLSLNQAAMKRR